MVPAAAVPARARNSIACSAPGASVPRAQETTWAAAVQPAGSSTGSRPVGSVSVTTTFCAATVPEFEATSRKLPMSPTATVDEPTTLFAIPTSTVPGVNETRSSLLVKSGSKLKTPATGGVLLDSARLSTCVPALSGASVLWIVITRSSPGPSWGMSQTTNGSPGPRRRCSPRSGRTDRRPVPPEIDIPVGGF